MLHCQGVVKILVLSRSRAPNMAMYEARSLSEWIGQGEVCGKDWYMTLVISDPGFMLGENRFHMRFCGSSESAPWFIGSAKQHTVYDNVDSDSTNPFSSVQVLGENHRSPKLPTGIPSAKECNQY